MGEPTLADLKAELTKLEVSLPAHARMVVREMPEELPDEIPVLVLERVRQGGAPNYHVHGYANCVGCGHLCYLGCETITVVATFQAYPLCEECSVAWVPPGTPIAGIFAEHPRTDGPH